LFKFQRCVGSESTICHLRLHDASKGPIEQFLFWPKNVAGTEYEEIQVEMLDIEEIKCRMKAERMG